MERRHPIQKPKQSTHMRTLHCRLYTTLHCRVYSYMKHYSAVYSASGTTVGMRLAEALDQ